MIDFKISRINTIAGHKKVLVRFYRGKILPRVSDNKLEYRRLEKIDEKEFDFNSDLSDDQIRNLLRQPLREAAVRLNEKPILEQTI